MPLIFALCLILVIFNFSFLPHLLAEVSMPFHNACVHFTPEGEWRDAYLGIVCGDNLQKDSFFNALRVTGLLHLMVVSGSHLVFLEIIVRKILTRNSKIICVILILFTAMTSFQPPVVRSLLSIFVRAASSRYKLHWPETQVVLIAGFLCWGLFPEWIANYSFILSWAAALSLASSSNIKGIYRHIFIYLFLIAFIGPLGVSHPISIVLNWLLAPLMGGLLFPLSLAIYVLPFLQPVGDFCWMIFDKLLVFIASNVDYSAVGLTYTVAVLWPLLWCAHLALYVTHVYRRRYG